MPQPAKRVANGPFYSFDERDQLAIQDEKDSV